MIRCWETGEQLRAEYYLNRCPDLWKNADEALEIIYEEICLRQEYGQPAKLDDFLARFPQWSAQLRLLFECHQLLGSDSRPLAFPAAHENFGDFRLLAELGRGANGRVFLATQTSLADRPMVLKLIPSDRQEHLSLARLQHTNIVPLYGSFEDPARGLRALCMPYFGGGTLDRVWSLMRMRPASLRTGHDLICALEKVHAATSDTRGITVGGPVCQFLAGSCYTDAVCWMGACLADALQYAQERGLVHLDVKPSNVLLAADGQPMLLDFHLAREPVRPDGPPPAWLGGTPAYMAPEQRAAIQAVRAGQKVPTIVDGRADVYALGLILYEALGGTLQAEANKPPAPLYRCNPQVSVGLADIISKCLSPSPADRYASAAALAADLRRHLSNQPLQGVKNRSLKERLVKTRRRRPLVLVWPVLVFAALVLGCLGVLYLNQQLDKGAAAREEGTTLLELRQFVEAEGAFQRGLALLEGMPFGGQLRRDLKSCLDRAKDSRMAQELDAVVDQVRFRYGDDFSSPADLAVLERDCEAIWSRRTRILAALPGLDSQLEEQLRSDLLDVAVLWSDVRMRVAKTGDVRAAHEQAIQVLNEAERLFGPRSVLYLARQEYARALGRAQEARLDEQRSNEVPARNAWEFYALARFHLRAGQTDLAAKELERSFDLRPNNFWTNYLKGQWACRRGKFQDAVVAFTACIVLRPEVAWCFYNLGVAHAQLGQNDLALHDYDNALDRDPRLAAAALNRGVLHYQGKHFTAARRDLQQALNCGADKAAVHYNLALVEASEGNIAAARENLKLSLEGRPDHQEARELLSRLDRRQGRQ
jgi:serine/threonine protein kinase/Tfp pilus assembly protein PilF